MLPIVSIITPVYKAEKYLKRCVDSIIAQTYTNWELILIDDGSPDKSGEICDNYAKADNRIKVIHKPNGGVSSARQAGLNNSTGDFVIHADSDDWLATDMLEQLVDYARKTNSDVVVFDFYRMTNGVNQVVSQKPSSFDHKEVLKDILGGRIYASCWNKLIRKTAIITSNAYFPIGINLGEDKCFLAMLLCKPLTISYLNQPLYYYDASINSDSLVRNITKASMESGFAMVSFLEKYLSFEYNNSIYNIKRNLKIRAYNSNIYTKKECKELYKEINGQILYEVICLKKHSRIDISLFLNILGCNRLASLIK